MKVYKNSSRVLRYSTVQQKVFSAQKRQFANSLKKIYLSKPAKGVLRNSRKKHPLSYAVVTKDGVKDESMILEKTIPKIVANSGENARVVAKLADLEIAKIDYEIKKIGLESSEVIKKGRVLEAEGEADALSCIEEAKTEAFLSMERAKAKGLRAKLKARADGVRMLRIASEDNPADVSNLLFLEKIGELADRPLFSQNLKEANLHSWKPGEKSKKTVIAALVQSLLDIVTPLQHFADAVGIKLPKRLDAKPSSHSEDSDLKNSRK